MEDNICSTLGGDSIEKANDQHKLQAALKRVDYSGSDLSEDQWKIEVRRWSEASLARVLVNVLDIVRDTGKDGEYHARIPPDWRAMSGVI